VIAKLKESIEIEYQMTDIIENERWKKLFEEENAFSADHQIWKKLIKLEPIVKVDVLSGEEDQQFSIYLSKGLNW
jgi:hypothetical protein